MTRNNITHSILIALFVATPALGVAAGTLALNGFDQIQNKTLSVPVARVTTSQTQTVTTSSASTTQSPSTTEQYGIGGEQSGAMLDDARFAELGSYGEHVKEIQHLLNKHGAWLRKTGYFGPATQAAAAAFQKANGISQTGAVYEKTYAALTSGTAQRIARGSSAAAPKKTVVAQVPKKDMQQAAPTKSATQPTTAPKDTPKPATALPNTATKDTAAVGDAAGASRGWVPLVLALLALAWYGSRHYGAPKA